MSVPGKIYIGQKVREMHTSPDWGSYSKVVLRVNEDEAFVSGDDSGLTFEAECPWATQTMADNVLASLSAYQYRPYDATGAIIHPAVELGDGVTSGGFYSGIYSLSRKFSKIASADLAAPSDTEVSHEFQHETQANRVFTRKMKEIKAEFSILSDRIESIVKNDNESFGWTLTSTSQVWKANGTEIMRLDKNGVKINGTADVRAVIAGELQVGGTNISASTLQSGANSGYNWANGTYGSSSSRWDYSLTGGGYGFNFNAASQYNSSSYGSYFHVQDLWAHRSLTLEGYVISRDTATINGTTIRYLKWTR